MEMQDLAVTRPCLVPYHLNFSKRSAASHSFIIYVGMHDTLIFWSIIYAIIIYLGLGFSAVCSKWLC